jgi:hypothetical protein
VAKPPVADGRVASRLVGYRRRCSRVTCGRAATATLTYVYADSTAVLGPLSTVRDPHGYDLCEIHAARLTVPLGWDAVRIAPDLADIGPSGDDLEALANAVREAAAASDRGATLFEELETRTAVGAEGTRRGHLRSLPANRDPEA